MHKKLLAMVAIVLSIGIPCMSQAAPRKTCVAEFTVAGAPNKDDLKATLHRILASRLNPGQVQIVEDADKAELLLVGSFAQFGKIFTLDVLLKNSSAETVTKVFEEGEGPDDLIPALGRLAKKIDGELAQLQAAAPPSAASFAGPSLSLSPAGSAAVSPVTPVSHRPTPASVSAAAGNIIRTDGNAAGTWTSDPLDGVFTGIALGRSLPSGEREIFLASEHAIRFLRKGAELTSVAEVSVPLPSRILTIDSADLDHDGVPEIYVTIMDRESLSSSVYHPGQNGLELVAQNQPWFFRGLGDDLQDRIILAQKMGADGGYHDGVAELVKTGNRFEAGTNFPLPGAGNVFSASRFRDKSGAEKKVLLDEGGHLAVFSSAGKELWRSSDRYGGSETYYKHASDGPVRAMGDELKWHFLEQRITALPDGTLLLPRNDGAFSVGNSRSYSKYTIHALRWTGALLKEIWHTSETQSYLADYAYDPLSHELIQVEVVQKKGLFTAGKTAISVLKID